MKDVPTCLNNLKSKVDKLNVDKLVLVVVDLIKLSDVLENDAVKKTEYNAKIKHTDDKIPDIANLTTNTTLSAKINEVKGEIPSITKSSTNASLNAKINEIKNKTSTITILATSAALNAVENKIFNVCNLVKKNSTPEFKKLTTEKVATRLAQVNLASKSDIANFVKKTQIMITK